MSNSTTYYPQSYLDEYIGLRLKAVAISFLILDCTFVAVRFYARYILRKRFSLWLDDWLIILSLIFCIGTQACAFIAVDDGAVGRHVQYTEQHYVMFRTWYQTCMIAVPVLYVLSAAFPKLSILYLYLQIFVDRLSRWSTWATIGAVIINVIVMIPVLLTTCHPISYGWRSVFDPGLEGGWCVDAEPRFRFGGLANIITDVAMLLIPMPTLYKLKTDQGTRIGLVATFGMAIAGLFTSCFRFAVYFRTSAYNDATWSDVELVSWCIAEPGIYMFVACQMAFRPLFVAASRSAVWKEMTRIASVQLQKCRSIPTRLQGKAKEQPTELSSHRHVDGSHTFGCQGGHETHIEAEMQGFPSAPPSVYNDNIWICQEYNVRNCSDPNNPQPVSITRRPSSC